MTKAPKLPIPFTQHDFIGWAGLRLTEVMDLLEKKGKQYSEDGAFDNFIEGAFRHLFDPL